MSDYHCKFCGCDNATEPINDEEGNEYLICAECDKNELWESVKDE